MFRVAVFAAAAAAAAAASMPKPFTRNLQMADPEMTGDDVMLAQGLLGRTAEPPAGVTSSFDETTAASVKAFQAAAGLSADGVLGPDTAAALLDQHTCDGYVDDGTVPEGYLYKLHVPVYQNRSIETTATLYDAELNVLHSFTVRTHGHDDPDTGLPLNQFTSNGATVTGLSQFDLNSPEPDPDTYGPYPVNRMTQGLQGNSALMYPEMRYGILLHTGNWSSEPGPMPNSEGCIHAHAEDVEAVWQALVGIGVEVRDNPFGVIPYPYEAQGVVSVEYQDC